MDITSKIEPGEFPQDIVLGIEKLTKDADGNYRVIAKGTYQNIVVGLEVIIQAGMRHGLANDDIDRTAFYKNGIVLASIGIESDKLIKAMAGLYGVTTEKTFSAHPVAFTSFALETQELDINQKPTKFKLFFDDTDALGLYCELYMNIDAQANVLEIREKSNDYRENIIKALTLS